MTTKPSPISQCRQNFKEDCEAGINKQINLELYASYVYLSAAYYFDRDDVALPGLFKYFKHQSDEEREHAQKLMIYQNKRGGRIVLHDIKKPELNGSGTALEIMELALALEKEVNKALLELHATASAANDPHFTNFLEDQYLDEQVESIKELSDYITNLKRVGPDLGVYLFDKLTMGGKKE